MHPILRLLPTFAFFLLLGLAVFAGYRIGVSRDPGTTSATVYTCSMHPQVRQNGPGDCPICHMELVPLESVDTGDGPVVRIDPVVVQNMGVRTVPVERRTIERSLRAFAVLREAETRLRDISVKVDGFVDELFADTEGMALRRGDPLFSIYSRELIVAQEELIAARASGDAELLATARQKLALWDVPVELIDELQGESTARRTLTWRSPLDGVLVARNIVEGAPAAADRPLLRIADLSVLWLDAQVPETQIVGLTVGQSATASFAARPGTDIEGKVMFVSPWLDPTTRTGTVRIEVENTHGELKPGMFARVKFARPAVPNAVVVPLEAILDTGTRQVAWIALGHGRFEPREVVLGAVGDGKIVEVRSGLAPGEHVVVSGQFLIDSESRLREATRKMQDGGLVPDDDRPPEQPGRQLDATTQALVDELLRAYLGVAEAFALDSDDPDGWNALRAAAENLHDAAPEALAPATQALHGALHGANAARANDLASRRQALIAISDAAIALFRTARPSAAFGDSLHVMHCPMVPADWLQTDESLRNPYYGSEMLRCGEETARLPLGEGTGK